MYEALQCCQLMCNVTNNKEPVLILDPWPSVIDNITDEKMVAMVAGQIMNIPSTTVCTHTVMEVKVLVQQIPWPRPGTSDLSSIRLLTLSQVDKCVRNPNIWSDILIIIKIKRFLGSFLTSHGRGHVSVLCMQNQKFIGTLLRNSFTTPIRIVLFRRR